MDEIIELELSILIAEDSSLFLSKIENSLNKFLPNSSIFTVNTIKTIDDTLKQLEFDILILDLIFPSGTSLSKIKELKKSHPNMFIIVSSSQSDIRTAIQAINDGTDHYIVKDDGFDSDLFLALHSITKSIQTRNQLDFMTSNIFDPVKYPMVLMKASEIGVSEVLRDFDEFPEKISNTKDFIQKIGVSLIVSLGQGDEYHTGVFQFPAVESKFYNIIDFAFRLNDSTAVDKRLKMGYFHLLIFVPNSFLSMFPSLEELTFLIDQIENTFTDASEMHLESFKSIKTDLFDQLKKHARTTNVLG